MIHKPVKVVKVGSAVFNIKKYTYNKNLHKNRFTHALKQDPMSTAPGYSQDT